MKNLNYTPMGVLLILIYFTFGCTPKSERNKKAADENVTKSRENVDVANENLRQAKLDSAAEYQSFRTQMELKLKENDQKIAELKAKAKSEKRDLDAAYAADLENLEKKNRELQSRVVTYKTSYADKWSSFKESFNQEMDEIGKSISRMAND